MMLEVLMAKKTFSVDQLKNTVNRVLSVSITDRANREGIIAVLEYVLHQTGNYRGYRYLCHSEVPDGHFPGIRFYDVDNPNFVDCDDTRRSYK